MPVPSNKTGFLSNSHNKEQFIHLLSRYLRIEGIPVEHTGDKGDSNFVIMRKALEYESFNKRVFVIADAVVSHTPV